MDLHTSGRNRLELFRCLNNELRTFFIKTPFWTHPTDNTTPTDSNIAILVCQKDGRTDPLVSPTRRIGPIDSCQNGNAQFFQFSMSEECGSASSPVGIHLFLFREF